MRLQISYLLCLIFAAYAYAAAYRPAGPQICVATCYYSLLKIKYIGNNETQQAACTNPLRVRSTYLCARQHCDAGDLEAGIEFWSGNCKNSSKVVNLGQYVLSTFNVTNEYLANLPTVALGEKRLINGTVVPTQQTFELVNRSLHTYQDLLEFNENIRWVQYGFWAFVVFVGIVGYVWSLIPPERLGRPLGQSGKTPSARRKSQGAGSVVKGWFKSHLLMAPTFVYRHHQSLTWLTIPLRLESMAVLGYIIIHVVLLSINYPVFENNYNFVTKKGQILQILGNRSGVLMAGSVPLLILFGGRSNLLILATGWTFRTFNIFHRWIGIVMTIEGLIHGVAYSAHYVAERGWDYYGYRLTNDPILLYGMLTAAAMGLAVALALGPVRRNAYEVFKVAHIAFAIISIVGFYQHVKRIFGGAYACWVLASIGIWSGEHALRIMRLMLMSFKTMVGMSPPALISYSDETGMIRLQVHPSLAATARQTPGTYYYVYFPGWRFWEAHPFTLAGRSTQLIDFPSDVSEKMSGKVFVTQSGTPSGTQSPRTTESGVLSSHTVEISAGQTDPYLTFLIKPRDGMTRRLRESLTRKGSSGQRQMRVLLEGPYGTPARLDQFDDILFIAGGSGITTVLPYMRKFFEDFCGSPHTPNVRLAWTVREEGFIRDVLANDLRLTENSTMAETKLSMEFYVTSYLQSREGFGKAEYRPDARFRHERPDIEAIVENFVAGAEGRPAVFVCGPPEMADKTRLAVRRQVSKGETQVELFEEMFCW